MSTTVGNGLTVDGTVKASQATQAGEAVVLGEDGLIPEGMLGASSKMNKREFSSLSDVLTALGDGDIPPYAKTILEGYVLSGSPFLVIINYLSDTYKMPVTAFGRYNANVKYDSPFAEITVDGRLLLEKDPTLITYTVTKATVYWRD